MAQTLLIGLGGTGSRVVNNVVKDLNKRGKAINNGEICCAVLDTNKNDNKKIRETGSGVPVIATSKDRTIGEYFDIYNYREPLSWCPDSASLRKESMLDGASQMRFKSNLALMDTISDGTIIELENIISKLLNVREDAKIRVMIVSSISGGTGAGMFIQTAIWLRKFFDAKRCGITIRGIFLLPDIFVKTLTDLRKDGTDRNRHYANAYAAIRELNSITKIMLGKYKPDSRIVIDGIFDSDTDYGYGKPVYDYAFFLDHTDERGASLSSLAKYEKIAAQLVYMQLYAPMVDDLYSEEDNTYLRFADAEDPLYGSCGTAKAVYPVEDIVEYASLRAAKDSLTGGWKKIDQEIAAMKADEEAREKDGVYSDEKIDPRAEYIRLFDDKASKKGAEVGKFRLFVNIANDVKEGVAKKTADGRNVVDYYDKIGIFTNLINKTKIDTLVASKGGLRGVRLQGVMDGGDATADKYSAWKNAPHTREELIKTVNEKAASVERILKEFEKNVAKYADEIASTILPLDMGEVNKTNNCSVYGLLTKANADGERIFVHPVAARYLLYRLESYLRNEKRKINLTESRKNAINAHGAGKAPISFDNESTKNVAEDTPIKYLQSKTFMQNEKKFLAYFLNQYADFNDAQFDFCKIYETEALKAAVYDKLLENLEGLIKNIEAFFKRLDDVSTKIDESLLANLELNEDEASKIIYVYADRECKEAIYQSLDIDVAGSNSKLNESIIDSVYGKLCAEKRPSSDDNKKYANMSVAATFLADVQGAFTADILKNNKDEVDLDICTAICKESDLLYKKAAEKRGEVESEDDEFGVDNTTRLRRDTAINDCIDKLKRMAVPFLLYDREVSKNRDGSTTALYKTFWGFHPAVVEAYPELGVKLGINTDLQQDFDYDKNELYLYNAIYGLSAYLIPKFNETKNGEYYRCYSMLIDQMLHDMHSTTIGGAALIQTPHLNKTWHSLLPYVTAEKQFEEDKKFYKALWLAFAYGRITVDNHGHYQIVRVTKTNFGSETYDKEVIRVNDKPIDRADVPKLITFLKNDSRFMLSDIADLEAEYKREMEELNTYVGTTVFKGLTTAVEDVNPINVIVRFNVSRVRNVQVTGNMIGALEDIARDLVDNYNMDRSKEQLEEAKFRLCKRIYDSATRSKGRTETFGAWEAKFERYNLKDTVPAGEGANE